MSMVGETISFEQIPAVGFRCQLLSAIKKNHRSPMNALHKMPTAQLLVSVRSAREAAVAVDAGVDLIDVKEPRRGALGPADVAVWREVLDTVAGRRPVSVALGELLTDDVAEHARLAVGCRFAKIGLAGCAAVDDWQSRLERAFAQLPREAGAVAVVYADWRDARTPPPTEIVEHAARIGCVAVLIDTHQKQNGDLFRQLAWRELAELCDLIHGRQMLIVVGGSLSLSVVSLALRLRPAFLAVRGAVCRGERDADVDAGLVRQWVDQLCQAGRAIFAENAAGAVRPVA